MKIMAVLKTIDLQVNKGRSSPQISEKKKKAIYEMSKAGIATAQIVRDLKTSHKSINNYGWKQNEEKS